MASEDRTRTSPGRLTAALKAEAGGTSPHRTARSTASNLLRVGNPNASLILWRPVDPDWSFPSPPPSRKQPEKGVAKTRASNAARYLKTKRWNDPAEPDDGHRILICRYRPRGVRTADESWDEWLPQLGPSRELHAAFYGKNGPRIGWIVYRKRYLNEMEEERTTISALLARAARGERITLLCSSACVRAERCHRTLLKGLIVKQAARTR